jgi:hypothetical protein
MIWPGVAVGVAVGVGVGVTVGVGVVVGVTVGLGLAVAVAVGVGVGVVPQARKKIETLPESWLATARSCLASPLKSPTATKVGPLAPSKLMGALKLPVPLMASRYSTDKEP